MLHCLLSQCLHSLMDLIDGLPLQVLAGLVCIELPLHGLFELVIGLDHSVQLLPSGQILVVIDLIVVELLYDFVSVFAILVLPIHMQIFFGLPHGDERLRDLYSLVGFQVVTRIPTVP